jgi:hypothetical protein
MPQELVVFEFTLGAGVTMDGCFEHDNALLRA